MKGALAALALGAALALSPATATPQQTIDGIADAHIKDTGHSGYSTNVPITGEVLVSEGFTREVTDSPAYDESVPDKLVCTLCGEEKPATAE